MTAVAPPGRYGALEIDDGQVQRFIEKPPGDNGADQRRLLRAAAEASLARIAGDADDLEHGAAGGPGARRPARGLPPRRLLGGDGHPARQEPPGGAVGVGRGAVAALNRGLLARQAGPADRPHRLQGLLGGDLAVALGAEVTGLALAPDQQPSLFELAGVEDLVDRGSSTCATRPRSRPPGGRCVRPGAAHGRPADRARRDRADPVGTFATNVMGTVHLLQALRAQPASLKAVLVVTSDKVYANRDRPRLRRGRRAGRQGSLFGVQGRDRDRRAELREELFRAGQACRWPRPRRQRHRRRRLLARTGSWPTSSAPRGARQPVVLRHPEATGPGSTCWTAWRATSSICRRWRPSPRRRGR